MGLWNHTDTRTKMKFMLVNKLVNSLRATVTLQVLKELDTLLTPLLHRGLFTTLEKTKLHPSTPLSSSVRHFW